MEKNTQFIKTKA